MVWADRLHALWLADQPLQALQVWQQACEQLAPADRPHLNHGNVLRDLNRFEAADAAYAQASSVARDDPERIAIAWNHSQLLIGLERYREAYALAEQRFQLPQQSAWRPGPYFRGWSTPALPAAPGPSPRLSLTLWSEQGYGDTLQYLRWIVPLIEAGCSIQLEVEPPLLPLLREGLAWLGPALQLRVKGIAPVPLQSPCQGSLLSLPDRLGQAPLASVFQAEPGSGCWRGYLRHPSWPRPAPRTARRPRLGLVWASGRKHEHPFIQREYERRSLPAPQLQSLLAGLAATGADLVCLQFGPDRERAAGWSGRFAASLADSISLADTARCIAGLDLVITVDTATAHLVGAMAHPGWVLLPWGSDPRWLRDRPDSPWYPSLTLLRQPRHRDWQGLVELTLERFRAWHHRWGDRQG